MGKSFFSIQVFFYLFCNKIEGNKFAKVGKLLPGEIPQWTRKNDEIFERDRLENYCQTSISME